jgi:hypothetical protein
MAKKHLLDTTVKIVLFLAGVKMVVYSIALPVNYAVLVLAGGISVMILAIIK